MSTVRTFFRHCPNCGRRFEIHLVSKQMVDAANEPVAAGETPGSAAYGGVSGGSQPGSFVDLGMLDRPIMVDIKEFTYAYRCSHCGHTWTEFKTEE